MAQEYRVIASREDEFSRNELDKKPGVKTQLVLISADGTKGTIDDPADGLRDRIEHALYEDREIVFTLKADGSNEVVTLAIGGTAQKF